jgi:hypothetical protein
LIGSEQEIPPEMSPAWRVRTRLLPAASPLEGTFAVIEAFAVDVRVRSATTFTKAGEPCAGEESSRSRAAAAPDLERKVTPDRMVPM